MATQVLRSSKIEPGGAPMMPALPVSADVPPPVRRYLIAIGGKERVDFYNSRLFAGDSRLIGYRNPFARQKNLPNTDETQLVPTGVIDGKMAGLVTTSHLLLAIHRRRATSLLPFSQPISHFADSHSQRAKRGRGVRPAHPAKVLRSKSAHGNFIPIGFPAPFLLLSKKRASNRGPIPSGLH
jgi:hypothetical protein